MPLLNMKPDETAPHPPAGGKHHRALDPLSPSCQSSQSSQFSPPVPPPAAPAPAAVYFDAVHTLFDLEPDYAGAFARVARDFGYPVELPQVEAALIPLLDDLDRRKKSDISHACTPESLEQEWIDFNNALFRAVGIDGDALALSLEVERRFDSGLYATVYPEAWPALDAVAAMGVATGIISNGTKGMVNCLEVLGLSKRVGRVLVSALVGFEKPATEIFREAERAVGLPPERCLLIGDNYWADVAGAKRAGWEAIWLNPKSKPAPGPVPCREIRSLAEAPALVRAWLEGKTI